MSPSDLLGVTDGLRNHQPPRQVGRTTLLGLTASGRNAPPYHAIQTATGGSRWQRFRPRSSRFRATREPNVCHPLRPLCSITVPSQEAQKRAPWRATPADGGRRPTSVTERGSSRLAVGEPRPLL